jgi:hypothetical protein
MVEARATAGEDQAGAGFYHSLEGMYKFLNHPERQALSYHIRAGSKSRKEREMKKGLKKLALSKETLQSLDSMGLEKAVGGATAVTCPPPDHTVKTRCNQQTCL